MAQATNPNDFALQARGIGSTSDARWDSFDAGDKEAANNGAESIKVDRF